MSPIVVDNSLVLFALAEAKGNELLWRRLSAPRILHAPHLIDFEFTNALRGLVLGSKLPLDLAENLREDFADLPIERHPGPMLADRIWELRANYTAYDAAYIALAELLDCPLLTGDAKLLGPHRAQVELYPM